MKIFSKLASLFSFLLLHIVHIISITPSGMLKTLTKTSSFVVKVALAILKIIYFTGKTFAYLFYQLAKLLAYILVTSCIILPYLLEGILLLSYTIYNILIKSLFLVFYLPYIMFNTTILCTIYLVKITYKVCFNTLNLIFIVLPIYCYLLAYYLVVCTIKALVYIRQGSPYKESAISVHNLKNITQYCHKRALHLYSFTRLKSLLFVNKLSIFIHFWVSIFLKLVNAIKILSKETSSFFYNVIVLMLYIGKFTYISIAQLTKRSFWIQFKNILLSLYRASPKAIKNISNESKMLFRYTKYIAREMLILFYYDIFKVNKIKSTVQNNKINFSISFVLTAFLVVFSLFLFNSANNYKRLNNALGEYIVITSPTNLAYKLLTSEFFKPVRVYKIAISVENNNLKDTLEQENIDAESLNNVINALKLSDAPKEIPSNWIINVVLAYSKKSQKTTIQQLSLPINSAYDLNIKQANNGYFAETKEKLLTRYVTKRIVRITKNFYASLLDANLPKYITNEVIKLVSWDLDLQRDVKLNDRLGVVYECLYNQYDELVSCDNILYLSFKGNKASFNQYYYNGNYYSDTGGSAAKVLMLTPVKQTRISSTYGDRLHPILGYNIFHKGVDFAGTRGTPVYASGKGKIVKMNYTYGYGNYIKIQHNNGLSTAYAHLNKFAEGMKINSNVEQWQLIGYVGSTGNVTGPHLHYEVLINNRQVNPLSIKTSSEFKLAGRDLRQFYIYKTTFDNYMIRIPGNSKTSSLFTSPNVDSIF